MNPQNFSLQLFDLVKSSESKNFVISPYSYLFTSPFTQIFFAISFLTFFLNYLDFFKSFLQTLFGTRDGVCRFQ